MEYGSQPVGLIGGITDTAGKTTWPSGQVRAGRRASPGGQAGKTG
jgi:hypothetical protein